MLLPHLIKLQMLIYVVYAQNLGENCEILGKGPGKCLSVEKCPSALEEIKKGHKPQTCGFNKNIPIVCCLNKSVVKCQEYTKEAMKFRMYAIAGGQDAVVLEFPHMAALGFGDPKDIQWVCGGSLISEKFVLTAAHCMKSALGEVKYVRIGDIRLDGTSPNAEDYQIIRRIPHPNYKPPSTYHDIALVELDRPIKHNPFIRPACLHTDSTTPNETLKAIGWGLTTFGGSGSNVLQKVDLKLFSNQECSQSYRSNSRRLTHGIMDETQICAGGRDEEKDTCQGDSGGPLQVYRYYDYFYEIVGVTSFGQACGTVNIPGVYTKVSKYVPWIESVVWP